MRTLRLTLSLSILLTIPTWNSLALAEPKPLLALTRLDEMRIQYEFPQGVRWCFNQWHDILSMVASAVTIDIDPHAGTITFESADIGRKVICETLGVRMFNNGVEEFTKF